MWQMTNPCHLQSYLARCCIAIWQHFCNALWHRITITYSMISTETMMATRRSGTDGLTEDQRLIAFSRFQILRAYLEEDVPLARTTQEHHFALGMLS